MSLLGSFFGGGQETKEKISHSLDMVTRAASLASNVTHIDPILDEVRMVTAKLEPGETISNDDNAKLIHAYLQIEEYLITKESLRTFTKEDLRGKYTDDLRQRLTAYEAANGRNSQRET
jgi:hypothetical protein